MKQKKHPQYFSTEPIPYAILFDIIVRDEYGFKLFRNLYQLKSNNTETKEQYQFYPTAISNWLFFGLLFLSIAVICFTNNYYPCF